MCGVAGVMCGERERAIRCTESMVGAQRHRGPDDAGVQLVCDGGGEHLSIAFGSARLAIQDLSSAGHQPMHDSTTGNWIAYNGEVYNFLELRRELEAKGEKFSSGTDTEVLLCSYKIWGREAVQRWHGMFACAIWDLRRREVLLARDALGVKPLYWAFGAEGAIVFGSELRALLTSGLVSTEVDPAGVSSFLTNGAVRAPATMLRHVRSLMPGSLLAISSRGEVGSPVRYWDLAQFRVRNTRDPNAVIKTRSALQDAVESNLVSDVPVAVFLSGGLDSSAVVALASKVSTAPLRTFSVVFQDRAFDERTYARDVAQRWRSDHVEVALAENDVQTLIEDAVAALDQPSVDGVNTFLVSRCARQAGIKVAMSGLGADEVFGGYSTFRRLRLIAKYRPLAALAPAVARSGVGRAILRGLGQERLQRRLKNIANSGDDVLGAYQVLRALFSVEDAARLTGSSGAESARLFASDDESLRARTRGLDVFHQVSLLEMEMYMSNMLLRDADTMSMANSLEVRVPLLERQLVEYVWSLPMTQTWRPGTPKSLLREALGRDLPSSAVNRAKMGFSLPWPRLIMNDLRLMMDETFREPLSSGDDVLDWRECRGEWSRFLSRGDPRDWSRVWGLFVLRRWLDQITSIANRDKAHAAVS